MQLLVRKWFDTWEKGNFSDLPLSEDFEHTSPYGTIRGKEEYLRLVAANREQFLGHRFILHDELYNQHKASVRYTAEQGDFQLEVTEWHFEEDGLIRKIVAYYNIEGEGRIEL